MIRDAVAFVHILSPHYANKMCQTLHFSEKCQVSEHRFLTSLMLSSSMLFLLHGTIFDIKEAMAIGLVTAVIFVTMESYINIYGFIFQRDVPFQRCRASWTFLIIMIGFTAIIDQKDCLSLKLLLTIQLVSDAAFRALHWLALPITWLTYLFLRS